MSSTSTKLQNQVKLVYIGNPVTKERVEIACDLSVEQLTKLNQIADWNLSAVACRAVERSTIAAESVEVAENHYRVFLALSYMYGNTPAFSPLADDFWHTHLLFTWDYMHMCETIFGNFLHHQPGCAKSVGQNEAWRIMRDSRFKAIFGIDLYPYWCSTQNELWSANFAAPKPAFMAAQPMNCLFEVKPEAMDCLFPSEVQQEPMNCLFGDVKP